MPFNLIKKYNSLLELESLNEQQRKVSLQGIFNRDIRNNYNLYFNSKKIKPTPGDDEEKFDRLFKHLTTTTDFGYKREFDYHRSKRLHWIKFHIDERKQEDMLYFSVDEPKHGKRTYIYDKKEKYVIVLEPLRKIDEYYLLTAYFLKGSDSKRDKIERKYKRKLKTLL